MKSAPHSWLKALILFGPLVLSACGTLDGIYQEVNFDSDPRGLEVYEGEGEDLELIGRTPVIASIRRRSSGQLTFKGPGGYAASESFDCEFRWLVEGVGHGALLFYDWRVTVGATLVDLLTGGAYECPDHFFHRPSQPIALPEVTYCRRYLIVPPRHIDAKDADRLAKKWAGQALFKLKACDDFLPFEANRQYLDYLNLNRTSKALAEFDDSKLHFLAQKTGATHLVMLSAQPHEKTTDVSVEAFDLHQKRQQSMPEFAMNIDAKVKPPASILGPIPVTFDLYPNAIANGAIESGFEAKAREGYRLRGTDRNILNGTLRRVSFLSLTHPYGFEEWDYVYGLASSIVFFTEDIKWRRGELGRERDLSLTQIAPLYYFDVTAHTPIGAFSAGVGAGLYLGAVSQEGESLKGEGGLLVSSRLSYTAFLTPSIFGQVAVAYYRSTWRSYHPHAYGLADDFTSVSGMVGFYFPDWR